LFLRVHNILNCRESFLVYDKKNMEYFASFSQDGLKKMIRSTQNRNTGDVDPLDLGFIN
tara:strand:+ start:20640 stop:20816 length:177 start_codon:yes stop_codon:yes gene_type:complete